MFIVINKKINQGFTLMELVISISVFAILSLIIMGIYVAFSNNQWRAQTGQKVLNDGQYALEVMTREIRNAAIYYPAAPACPQDGVVDFDYCLRLERNDGTLIAFAGNDDSTEIYYAVYNGSTWNMTELINLHKIIDLDFVVEPDNSVPTNDPFIAGGVNQQPKVTIKLVMRPNVDRNIEKSIFRLQTTISSRVYKR